MSEEIPKAPLVPSVAPEAPAAVPQKSIIWIKDTAGYPSVSVTFVTVAFWATTLWFVLSIFAKVWQIEIRPFDPGAATAYLSPLLALYFGRRWTDAKAGNPNVPPTGK